MSIATWLAFAAASAVLLLIPGPTVLLVVSYALTQGRRVALAMAAGVALGDFTAMTLSLAGLGALLLTSATLFTVLKWVGAAYLVYLGVKLWRAEPQMPDVSAAPPATAGHFPARLRRHRAQSEVDRLLRRLRSAIHRSSGRASAATRPHGGDLRRPRSVECAGLRLGRRPASRPHPAQADAEMVQPGRRLMPDRDRRRDRDTRPECIE